MTPYASVCLFKRDGRIVYKPPRKERHSNATQARKAAMRYWRGNLAEADTLARVILVREVAGRLEISERGHNSGHDKPWVEFTKDFGTAMREPHLAACIGELGIDVAAAPQPVPDVLVINGYTYRRDI